jgi:hypothetical protein
MYNESTFLTDVKEFNELRKENSRYANALARYKKKTIKDFKDDYKSKGLKGKGVLIDDLHNNHSGFYSAFYRLIS